MTTSTEVMEIAVIRAEIKRFLADRLQQKLGKAKDSDDRELLTQTYRREVWFAEAAKRVQNLRLVTHTPKYLHPSIKLEPTKTGVATSILDSEETSGVGLVSSAGEQLTEDMVGDAKNLGTIAQDALNFLKADCFGRTFLDHFREREPTVLAALSDNEKLATQWRDAFMTFAENNAPPASDTLAKQLYFPLVDGGYHLLAPLYPTALAHRVYQSIDAERFSEESKAGRAARRAGTAHEGYREYPNLASRSFGGSKPQNISQLNSERGGNGYLLASLPPTWQSQGLRPPAYLTTIFDRWLLGNGGLWRLTERLKKFLAVTKHTNKPIREARGRMVNQIVDEVLYLVANIHQSPAGWSADENCRLGGNECLWLDPGRCETDEQFAALYDKGDWSEAVAKRFGRWLNVQIRSDRAPLDKTAAAVWEKDFATAMKQFQQEVNNDY